MKATKVGGFALEKCRLKGSFMVTGLRKKFLFPLLIVMSGILFATLLVSQFKAKFVIQNVLTEHLLQEVVLTSKMLDNWLDNRKKDISTWSTQDLFVEALTESGYYGKSARKGASEMLSSLHDGYPYYNILFLAQTNGDLLVTSKSALPQKINIAERLYFQQALQGQVAISNVIIDKIMKFQVFAIASPLKKEGKVVGIIAAVVPLTHLKELFVDNFHLLDKSYGYLFHQGGSLITISDPGAFQKVTNITEYFSHQDEEQQAEIFTTNNAGEQMLTTVHKLVQAPWYFGISQSMSATLYPLAEFTRISLISGFILLVLGSIIVVVLVKIFILNRLTVILKGMEQVSAGNYTVQIPVESRSSSDEITVLGDSFNAMIRQLDKMVTALNIEISARRKAEETLARHQENLTSIIETRSKELEQAILRRKEMEIQLDRAEKMEMIGTLAGGVAHDLNNILSGIVSYPDLLLTQISTDSPLYKPLCAIKTSGLKAAAIVQDLLTLARRGLLNKEPVNFNDVIEEYLESPEFLEKKKLHPEVILRTNLAYDLLPVSGAHTQLAKIIMNLVVNGMEAMSSGELTVCSENIYVDKGAGLPEEITEGGYVMLQIKDQGEGISPEAFERIFEPFYTTKKMGKSGTGLGMAIVWSTVQDHDGFIFCDSEPQQGTVFTLYFPVTRHLEYEQSALPNPEQSFLGRGERVLVVDDIEEQRDLAKAILTRLGYQVTVASSGEEALILARHLYFDILVLDMILGEGIDGYETYRQILQIHPEQKAIITSGFSDTDRIEKTIALGASQYIKKPYLIDKLGLGLRAALDEFS